MPKEINLGTTKPTQPTKEELLARVTSKPQAKKIPVPPQQKGLPPGSSLPLPTGKIISAAMPSGMSAAEREALDAIGWTPDVPIPTHMAEILERERVRRVSEAEEIILPVDPNAIPVKPPQTKDFNKLSPEEQKRILNLMRQSYDEEKKQYEEKQRLASVSTKNIPGLEQALGQVAAAEAKQQVKQEPIVDDRGAEPKAEEIPQATESSTGADVKLSICPHCNWDLQEPDIAEPAYKDKMVFLHALLGQKPYIKEYELFGGHVLATFRTLTTSEIDVIYKQAWRDRETQKILTEIDHWERINRYRLFLQLSSLKSSGSDGFSYDLPDGLSKETNPNCEATWNIGENVLHPMDTPLPLIEEWLVQNVLRTEALFRVVNFQCSQFNRLVARLEALADNSDFWKQTEEQF